MEEANRGGAMILESETTKSGTESERSKAIRSPRPAKKTTTRVKRAQDAVRREEDDAAAGRLVTLTEAAFRLGRVHRTTIMRWVKEGKLKCVRLSRKAILFEQGELDRFIREHRSSG
jgi:excisionase family DNA binding protein